MAKFLDEHVVTEAHLARPLVIVQTPHMHIREVFKVGSCIVSLSFCAVSRSCSAVLPPPIGVH